MGTPGLTVDVSAAELLSYRRVLTSAVATTTVPFKVKVYFQLVNPNQTTLPVA